MAKEIKGIISSSAAYSNMGDGDAFAKDTISSGNDVLDAAAQIVEKPEVPTSGRENPALGQPPAPRPLEGKGSGYLLSVMAKEEGFLPQDMDLPDNITPKEVRAKIAEHLRAEKDSFISSLAEKEGLTPDVVKYAKLLNSGLSPSDQNELAKLKAFASVDLEDYSEVGVDNMKVIISAMYQDRLTGKSLEKAIDGIDPEADDFEEIAKEAVDYWKTRHTSKVDEQLQKQRDKDNDEISFSEKAKSILESGEINGVKLTSAEIKRYQDDIYKKTEKVVITDKDGNKRTEKYSKYEKNAMEIAKDPAKLMMLMMLISDNLDLKLPKEIGKGEAGAELEDLLAASLGKLPGTTMPRRPQPAYASAGIIKTELSKTY